MSKPVKSAMRYFSPVASSEAVKRVLGTNMRCISLHLDCFPVGMPTLGHCSLSMILRIVLPPLKQLRSAVMLDLPARCLACKHPLLGSRRGGSWASRSLLVDLNGLSDLAGGELGHECAHCSGSCERKSGTLELVD